MTPRATSRAKIYPAASVVLSKCALQPTAREPGAPEPDPYIGALPHQVPDQLRAIVFDHHYGNALVESEVVLGRPTAAAVAGEGRIETARQHILWGHLRISLKEITYRGHRDRRCKRYRRERSRWRDGSVVRSIRHAAGGIFEKASLSAVNAE